MFRWLFGKKARVAATVAEKAPERLARVQRLEEVARRAIVEKHRAELWREAEKAAKARKYRLELHHNVWPHETDAMPDLAKAMEADGFIVSIKREERMGEGPGNSNSVYMTKYVITLDWRVGQGVSNGK